MNHPCSSSISLSYNALAKAFPRVWANKQIVCNWLLLAVVANVPADLSICNIFRLPHPWTASVFTYDFEQEKETMNPATWWRESDREVGGKWAWSGSPCSSAFFSSLEAPDPAATLATELEHECNQMYYILCNLSGGWSAEDSWRRECGQGMWTIYIPYICRRRGGGATGMYPPLGAMISWKTSVKAESGWKTKQMRRAAMGEKVGWR